MQKEKVEIGLKVVRSIGDYVVGRVGPVVEIDFEKERARVAWEGEAKTWVRFAAIEDAAIPYNIIPGYRCPKKRKPIFAKYQKV